MRAMARRFGVGSLVALAVLVVTGVALAETALVAWLGLDLAT
jgi:hypothetical protein